MGGKRSSRALIAAALVVSMLAGLPGGVAGAKSGNGPGQESPTNPYTGATPVLMACDGGQTDINHAAVAELTSTLGLDVAVANRLAAARPYLQPSDLLVVNGIGPDKVTSITSQDIACATLITEPPAAGDACTTTNLVDLQLATERQLRDRLGLSKPQAVAIVKARPYAVKSHVTPERVPGLGKGGYDKLARATCLTPPTVDTGTTRWEWIYSTTAATVARGDYSISVPANVINAVGAYVSVEQLTSSPIPLEGPAGDFHIWAPWEDGNSTVTVGVPTNNTLSSLVSAGHVSTLAHVPDDPTDLPSIELSTPANTTVQDGVVLAQTTSLSTFVTTAIDVAFFSGPVGSALRFFGVNDYIKQQALAFLAQTATPPTCPRGAPARTWTSGDAVTTSSELSPARPPLLFCVDTASNGDAFWRLRNNSGSVLSVDASPTSVKIADVGGPIPAAGGTGNFIVDQTYDVWNLTGSHNEDEISRAKAEVPPAAEVVLRVPEYAVDQIIQFEVASAFNVGTLALRSVGQLMPPAVAASFAGANCGLNTYNMLTDATALANCTVDVTDAVLRWGVGLALVVGDAVATVETGIRGEIGGPWQLNVSHEGPPADPTTSQPTGPGSPTPGGSPAPDGKMILKVSTGPESWLLDAEGVAHPIPDGGTYECLADRYPVRYHLEPHEFGLFATGGIGDSAVCPLDMPPVTFAPDTATETYGINGSIIRREDGAAWIVDANGYRAPILDGATFNCFADLYLVWDLLTTRQVEQFPRDPSVAARFCTAGT